MRGDRPERQADPLSELTRREKRNLLAISLFAITAKAFDIHLKEVELNGNKVSFDESAVPFVLVLAGAYFLVTFVMYWIIDIKNAEMPEHYTRLPGIANHRFDAWRLALLEEKFLQISKFFSNDRVVISPTTEAMNFNGEWRGDVDRYFSFSFMYRDIAMTPDDQSAYQAVAREISLHIRHWAPEFRSQCRVRRFIYNVPTRLYMALYVFRNYVWDFLFPLALALYAGGVLVAGWNPDWIKNLIQP